MNVNVSSMTYTRMLMRLLSTTGKYFQYRIQPIEKRRKLAVTTSAFDVLMNAQRELVWPDTPEPLNKKQQMWNDLVHFLRQKGLGWSHQNVASHGKVFVSTLCDALWIVNGHWKKFADRAKPLPRIFEKFQGYKVPESYKKKKLEHSRLDRVSLLKHSDRLNETLQEPWLCKSRWQEVRKAILLLSDHVHDYTYYYLELKCREVKTTNCSTPNGQKAMQTQ